MGFRVQLASDTFSVEPGVAASVAFELNNEGGAAAKVEVQVEGIDPEWLAIPVPVIDVPSGESVTERFFLKPPREPESLSGVYPFVVRFRSEGEQEKVFTCSLEVKPFHNVSIDVQPRRGLVSPFSREATFQATVMNLGNQEHSVKLFASDHGELFSFEFDHEQMTVAPGAQKTVSVTANAVKSALLANARLQQFTVSARSLDDKTVATAAHAQIEQRAWITPGIMWLAALLVFIFAAFIVLLPKAPVVDAFTVTPDRVWLGDSFTVEWSASNARSAQLVVDGHMYSDLGPSGKMTILADRDGQIEVRIKAMSGRKESDPKTRIVMVGLKEVPPDPKIIAFMITPTDLKVGEAFQVTYKLSDSVTEAKLEPIGVILDVNAEAGHPHRAGRGRVRLQADRAQRGRTRGRKHSARESRPWQQGVDHHFSRRPSAFVDPLDGRVTLTWQVNNSSRIELVENGARGLRLEDLQGQIDRIIDKDTTFKLVVWDDDGVTAEKEVTVKTRILDGSF